MPYLIATDEAGLGPNLGPLVVSATLWQLPDQCRPDDLYTALSPAVAASPRQANPDQIVIADSKQLYKPGGSLAHLERAVLTALATVDRQPTTWRELFHTLDPASHEYRDSLPWYADFDQPIPLDVDPTALAASTRSFTAACSASQIQLQALRSRVVYPPQFNTQLETCGGKGQLLSHTTLALAAELAAPLDGSISIVCDKHGGRNRYAHLLADHFPDTFIEVHGETRDLSVYRFGPTHRRVEAQFRTRAESVLAVGLASMVSKYLRELSMQAFNHFWCAQVPGLKPTAGYPQDAKRFRTQADTAIQRLGIEQSTYWRCK